MNFGYQFVRGYLVISVLCHFVHATTLQNTYATQILLFTVIVMSHRYFSNLMQRLLKEKSFSMELPLMKVSTTQTVLFVIV